ncbi:hypothetical protein L0Z64_12475 [Phaeobacter sp. BS23]|uniref:hypothetical protein n=1 Tax=Phaeobacter sp. BS23 TaxID=2907239 RepID=UPI003863F80F
MANRDSGKTPANVAGHATQKDALRRNRLSLLGLFGASNNLSAMVRMPSGRTQVVTRGSCGCLAVRSLRLMPTV